MDTWRVIERVWRNAYRSIALVWFLAVLSGCRDSQSPEQFTSLPSVQFKAGDRFLYEGWITDSYGLPLDSSNFHRVWQVLATDAQRDGYNDVVVLHDSASFTVIDSVRVDTLYLRTNASGWVYWYGFLSDLIARRESRKVGRQWDPVVGFGESAWTVGMLDSAGQEPLTAKLAAQKDYFSVKINNVSTAIPAWRVEMNGQTLDYFLWVCDSPPCFPRLEEDSDPFDGINSGSLMILREAAFVPRPSISSGQAKAALGTLP
jgi:hypothetical protein